MVGPTVPRSLPRYSRTSYTLLSRDRGAPDALGGNTPQIINDRGHIAMPSAPAQ